MANLNVNIGKGLEFVVDTSKFNQEVIDYVLRIGLRNILMDSHASDTLAKHGSEEKMIAASRETAEKKLQRMYDGFAPSRTSDGRTVVRDPVEAQARRIARQIVGAKADKAVIAEFAKRETVLDAARKQVEMLRELGQELTGDETDDENDDAQ